MELGISPCILLCSKKKNNNDINAFKDPPKS